jgi:MFS family permease
MSPFRHRNIRLFILFRVLFNARFYYPVFTVLFLDMGLSLEQFLLLNAVWAGTIILLEVPSGAMADTIGRRNLVIIAAVGMVLEMALLSFLPLGSSVVVFWGLLLNRVISGSAEAMASGADEALAFDTLKAHGEELQWARVLDLQMRLQAGAFVFAMLVGALVYDASAINWILDLVGVDATVDPAQSLRFPLYLCLLSAVFAVTTALSMREPPADHAPDAFSQGVASTLRRATTAVFQTGSWVVRTPVVLLIIAAAMTFDSTARTIITLASEYYRYINLPTYAFGIMGAGLGLLGTVAPMYARRLVERKTPLYNWSLLAVILGLTLLGMSFTIPYWGAIPVVGIGLSLTLIRFFSSHYLNAAVTDSRRRATVLSIQSLCANITYGGAGLIYMGFVAALREDPEASEAPLGESVPVFGQVMAWTPLYYLATLLVLAAFARWIKRRMSRFEAEANVSEESRTGGS